MLCNRLPISIKIYRPAGRWDQGRPLKRLLVVLDMNSSKCDPAAFWLDVDDKGDDVW
jgi:hypothetical protein